MFKNELSKCKSCVKLLQWKFWIIYIYYIYLSKNIISFYSTIFNYVNIETSPLHFNSTLGRVLTEGISILVWFGGEFVNWLNLNGFLDFLALYNL